jgi:hypothetical protein
LDSPLKKLRLLQGMRPILSQGGGLLSGPALMTASRNFLPHAFRKMNHLAPTWWWVGGGDMVTSFDPERHFLPKFRRDP